MKIYVPSMRVRMQVRNWAFVHEESADGMLTDYRRSKWKSKNLGEGF